MAGDQKPREGYGSTSEQRQRNLEGDGFEERAPHTPAESEAVRGSADKGGHVVHVEALPEPLDASQVRPDTLPAPEPSQPGIHVGMLVRNRDGEPIGRVLSVDGEGFVLERRIVVTREHRMRLEEIHAVDEHGIVLEQAPAQPRHGLEATDLVEVFWSARRARDEQRPLDERMGPESLTAPRVATTKHAEAYPLQVERGTVRSPRYVPMSEEPTHQAGNAEVQPPAPPLEASAEDTAPKRRTRGPWGRTVRLPRAEVVRHYATHPLEAATTLLDRLRGGKHGTRH
ncbi:hypothetical protein JQX13_20560 [Archangium violaceum]|uniref:hypothetical protein n=1 Tax=Archangium violaceum TaxID=83451 RepID=UPI00193BDE5A|nr:hypothetical protein [Archangium violaceum]QRK14267.1 hypothetical protein JQX13_20560 [Archangium violaceum]